VRPLSASFSSARDPRMRSRNSRLLTTSLPAGESGLTVWRMIRGRRDRTHASPRPFYDYTRERIVFHEYSGGQLYRQRDARDTEPRGRMKRAESGKTRRFPLSAPRGRIAWRLALRPSSRLLRDRERSVIMRWWLSEPPVTLPSRAYVVAAVSRPFVVAPRESILPRFSTRHMRARPLRAGAHPEEEPHVAGL
jgi:hypothetical protein